MLTASISSAEQRIVHRRVEVEAGLGLVQPLLVVVQRLPAGVQHLPPEAGDVDDDRGVAQLVARDDLVERAVHGGETRAVARRVHERLDAAVGRRLHAALPCPDSQPGHDTPTVRGHRTAR